MKPEVILELRLAHLKAQRAREAGRWHVAVQQYRCCLEQAERCCDPRCTSFFARQLSECYRQLGLLEKAAHFHALSELPAPFGDPLE